MQNKPFFSSQTWGSQTGGRGLVPTFSRFFFFEDVSNATVASYIRNTGGAKNTCYAEEGLPYTSGSIGCSLRPTVCVGSKDASCTALSHLSKKNIDHSEKQRKKLVTLLFPRWR